MLNNIYKIIDCVRSDYPLPNTKRSKWTSGTFCHKGELKPTNQTQKTLKSTHILSLNSKFIRSLPNTSFNN